MADRDWKKRVGIKINFSSDSSEDERDPEQRECGKGENAPLSPKLPDSSECSAEALTLTEDEFFNQLIEEYGTTPPRARIRRKERRHREKEEQSVGKKSPKVFYTSRTKRRNTLDSIYFDGLLEKSEATDVVHTDEDQYLLESSRRTKRSMKLLRGSERDMKLEQVNIRHSMPPMSEQLEEKTESMPAMPPQCPIKIESSNRFMSLTSKLVACREKMRKAREIEEFCYGQENRLELFNKVTHLIRTGCCDKSSDKHNWRQLSVEEHLWQNELKDLIWLELQAWHADQTMTEQDEFLCKAREKVGALLEEIMNYRFKPLPSTSCNLKAGTLSAQNSDSGMSCEGREDVHKDIISAETEHKVCPCVGCLSIYCGNCMENQLAALKDVQQMLNRLEAAEALYPSSKAFGVQYPLYKSPAFIGRVKSMCLWYNMTKHHCLKLRILGKHLASSFSRNYNWPTWGEDDSGIATDTSASGDDPPNSDRCGSLKKTFSKFKRRVVHFDTESVGSSPSDSSNSNVSLVSSDAGIDITDYADCPEFQNFQHNALPNPFRKYIEDVLKTRGIRKALNFLDKLHQHLLKSMVSLSQPLKRRESDLVDVNANGSVDAVQASTDDSESSKTDLVPHEQMEEIHEYGYWSTDAQALHLPSYRSAFLFLAHIPLDVIYELLKMRVEQKPANPSVLCIRQLMRELKEGLRMAALYRDRYCHLVRTALWNVDESVLQKFLDVSDFDQTCAAALQLYLQYLQQWVPMVQHERFHKNLLEDEWQFAKLTCITIPGAISTVGSIFCNIACGMFDAISGHLSTRMKEVMEEKDSEVTDEESSTRPLVMSVCREFQTLFNEVREKSVKAVGFAKTIIKDLEKEEFIQMLQDNALMVLTKALEELKCETLALRQDIATTIQSIQTICSKWKMCEHDEGETVALTSRCREVLHLSYKYSFEFHKEIFKIVIGELRLKLCQGYVSFAYQWMKFVDEWCERGRGTKPRWAYQGLEFLTFVCDPMNTCHLSDKEFENFQLAVEKCVIHVIGTASPVPEKKVSSPYIYHGGRGSLDGQRPRSRASSPASRTKSPGYRTSRSLTESTSTPSPPTSQKSLTVPDVEMNGDVTDGCSAAERNSRKVSRIERVRSAIKKLENRIDNKLLDQELIGSVTDVGSEDKIHIRSRSVTFSWQRGMKIGQGRFGKVYTAVNNQSGELLAMKEIQLQPNDHRTIRRVAEELRIFEGINHRSLVRYYGVEIHREEMLIFMEFCSEGTLESLVAATESGLPETLMRRFTHQLLEAVSTLHWHGVVHRDIKSANIFLTDEGNSLKLGDFGCAVKIKAHTTMPGELQGFVGTQAYMAPEVFMNTNTDGHGRAADIWSVGCVVVEMASGKRPWAEYDSNYQIMFKVGMGETPDIPASLSEEGHNFVSLCLQHDPRQRASANDLLLHSFVKVDGDEDYLSTNLSGTLDDYLKLVSGH